MQLKDAAAEMGSAVPPYAKFSAAQAPPLRSASYIPNAQVNPCMSNQAQPNIATAMANR
jgi:hypothetical protein